MSETEREGPTHAPLATPLGRLLDLHLDDDPAATHDELADLAEFRKGLTDPLLPESPPLAEHARQQVAPPPDSAARASRVWQLVAGGALVATVVALIAIAILATNSSTAWANATRIDEDRDAARADAARKQRLTEKAEEKGDAAARDRDVATRAVRELIDQAELIGPFQGSSQGGHDVLTKARGYLSEMAAVAERDPTRSGEAADMYRKAGRLAFNLGYDRGMTSDYDLARRLAEATFQAEDTPANRLRLAMILREWGVTRAVRWNVAEAQAAWDRAFQLLEPLAPAGAESRFTIAQLHMMRGNVAAKAKKREHYDKAERLIEDLLRDAPGDRKYRFTLAEILNNRAFLVGGDAAEWEPDCRRAVAIRRELVAEEPDRPEQKSHLAAGLNHHGNTLQRLGPNRAADAEAAYLEARDIYRALVLVFPGVASNREELKQVEANLKMLAARRAEGR